MSVYQGSWDQWVLDRGVAIKKLVQFVVIPLILTAILVVIYGLLTPAVWTMTTTHPLVYLPAKYELVENVTNIFVKQVAAGAAGGVGAPQVEMTSEMYRKNERETLHYLSLSHLGSSTLLNYWDIQPGKVVHASTTFDAPGWGLGVYASYSGRIDGNRLILERRFDASWVDGAVAVLAIVAIIVWVYLGLFADDALNFWLEGIRRRLGRR